MPLPVAHSLAGLAVFKSLDADGTTRAWPRLLLALGLAIAPDLDILPGILIREPSRYHHVFSHTLAFIAVAAVLISVAAAGLGKYWPLRGGRVGVLQTTTMVGALLVSHLLLDAFNNDLRPPAGLPVFRPFFATPVMIWPWFLPIDKLDRGGGLVDFVASLLTWHNLQAMLFEILTLVPVLALVFWWRNRADRRSGG